MLAVEKDDALHGHLKRRFAEVWPGIVFFGEPVSLYSTLMMSRCCRHLQVPALELVHGDVLDIRDMPELLASFSRQGNKQAPKVKVVANIPYNITSSALLTTWSCHAVSCTRHF